MRVVAIEIPLVVRTRSAYHPCRMGNPFVHLDLACNDLPAAKKFYGKVFDWKFMDMPSMNWSGINVGEGVGGGIGTKQNPNEPTAWTAYVGVADVKATIAKAEKAGATILVPYMEIPNMGYLGVFVDPQGATIGVWQQAATAAAPAAKKASKKIAKAAPPAAAPAKPAKPAAKKAAKAAPPAPAAPAKSAKPAAKKAAPPAPVADAKPAKKTAKKSAPPAPAAPAKPAKKAAKKK